MSSLSFFSMLNLFMTGKAAQSKSNEVPVPVVVSEGVWGESVMECHLAPVALAGVLTTEEPTSLHLLSTVAAIDAAAVDDAPGTPNAAKKKTGPAAASNLQSSP